MRGTGVGRWVLRLTAGALEVARSVLRSTIWAPGAIGPADRRISLLLRRYLVEFDLACIAFGVLGLVGGVPAVDDTFLPAFGIGWAVALIVTSAACLVGLAWPARLWRLELAGKSLLVSVIMIYAGAIVYAAIVNGDLGRGAVAALVYASTALPRWRITDIAADRRRNRWQ